MLRRSWIPVGLLLLLSPVLMAKTTPDRTREDCVEACIRKANPCYDKCETALKACRKTVQTKCDKIKDPHAKESCLQDGNRECTDEKEINCDPQCSIQALLCIETCPKKAETKRP